jgi:predicted DNA-binding protein
MPLTPEQISPTKRRMARPKRYGKPYLLRLTEETWERIEAVRGEQDRAGVIREAIERDLRRRERQKPSKEAAEDGNE